MESQSRLWSAPALLAVLFGLALRIVLALQTPIGGDSVPGQLSSYNDELAHANYALHILTSSSLPGQVESIQGQGALARGNYENYQPPLYYLLLAASARLVSARDLPDVMMAGRWLAIIFGAILILLWIRICRALNFDDGIASAGVIFVSLSGVLVRFTSTVGNESLLWVFAAALILISIRIRQDGLRPAHWMTFAALACLALYTKLTAILLLPLPLVVFARGWNARLAVSIAGMYCLILVCVFPLWLRNFYDFGSLLPLNAGFGEPQWRLPNFATALYAIRSFVFPWSEFWRGWIGLLFLIPFCVLAVWSASYRSGWRLLKSQPVLLAALLISLASFLWLNARYDQAEGRYLFTAWPALGLAISGQPRGVAALWLMFACLIVPYCLFLIPVVGS